MHDLWLLKRDTPSHPVLASNVAHAPGLRLWHSVDTRLDYLYATCDPAIEVGAQGSIGNWKHLVCVQELPGASADQAASHHYVVETDVLAEFEDDFNAWYAQEHLPGLAHVPGAVRASRYIDREGSPRYYACYDLTSADVLGSPAWLAVRGTAWSARVRPAFRNTRRTMFAKSPQHTSRARK